MMNSYIQHARNEFEAVGWTKDGKFQDKMQQAICKHVEALLEVFGNEGHSGSTAPYAVNLFKELAMFKPIGELKGDDSEWVNTYDNTYQNKRNSAVFKDKKDGQPYFIDAIVFTDQTGCSFTGCNIAGYSSHQYFNFPFAPKTFYVDVIEDGESYILANPTQLDAVREYGYLKDK